MKVKLDNGTLQPAPLTLQNTIYDQEGKLVATQSRSFDLTPQAYSRSKPIQDQESYLVARAEEPLFV